jgi:signal transduction histidine kinase
MVRLIELNLLILVASALAGYYWARRTLGPIEEAMEAQGRFAADASHQLRTPLAAMRTEIEVALRQKQISDSEARELFGSSLEELAKLEGLAGSLLQLARLESEVVRDQFRAVAVSDLLAAARASLKAAAKAKDIKLQSAKTADRFEIMGEPDSLQQIFQILLDNAIKFSPEGSTITIGTQKRAHTGAIAIADRGPGISDDEKAQIFDRFWRAQSQTGDTQGHGLGLAIAQQIASLHKGEIMVADRPGGGSVFTIELPLAH